MPALEGYDCDGSLTIGGISMNRPAWAIQGDETGQGGFIRLWSWFDVRGEDRIVPGAAGVVPFPRRITVTRHDLRILITGDVDETGAVNADPLVGLEENISYIVTNVVNPVVSSTGTRAATLTMPSGSTRTANIHVMGLDIQAAYIDEQRRTIAEGRLMISIPTGRFT